MINLTPEQRKARDEERKRDAVEALNEHRRTTEAFYENFERLKAERLAREARATRTQGRATSK